LMCFFHVSRTSWVRTRIGIWYWKTSHWYTCPLVSRSLTISGQVHLTIGLFTLLHLLCTSKGSGLKVASMIGRCLVLLPIVQLLTIELHQKL
jgi:hypothetical protein